MIKNFFPVELNLLPITFNNISLINYFLIPHVQKKKKTSGDQETLCQLACLTVNLL